MITAILSTIIALLFVAGGISFFAMSRMFRNQRTQHQNTPQEFGIPFEEVLIPAKNDKQCYGWWIRNQSSPVEATPTVILVHGWSRNVERLMVYIRNLYTSGYNILAFDSRNHGSSDPDDYSSMVKFSEDIQSCLDFLQLRSEVNMNQIGVIGLSIGGSAAILASSQDNRIKSIITVGSFAHPADLMAYEFKKHHIPYFPLIWIFFKYLEWKIGLKMDQIAPQNTIHLSEAKILLIHGENDNVCPVEQAEVLLREGNKDQVYLWRIPDKGHSDCHRHPEYWFKIDNFLQNSLQ